jgi:uncharacterized protein (TIGR02246 family)
VRHSICAALYATVVVSGFEFSLCLAQDAASHSPAESSPSPRREAAADLDAIRAESQEFVAAFNMGDAKAIAALWTEDGDYVDESGRSFAGRDAIEQAYAGFFADNPNVRVRIVIDSLRLLSDSAAIEDGRTVIDPAPPGVPAHGKYTAVHVKVDGKWLMSTVRDTQVETPSAYGNVADLEFLIGTWTAEEHGAVSESVCRWVANKSFVERSYTVTGLDGTTTSGVQLIGWNPKESHVQSWTFSSDGGHAVGVWTLREQGWSAEVQGVTGDGTLTSAVNMLTRLDDNAYVWQSIQRTAGGQSLPDTDEVVLKRPPADR